MYVPPEKIYGEVLEDRGSQISFSPLGQKVVDVLGQEGIKLKEEWGKTPWRPRIAEAVAKRLPEFNVKMGGLSTIDVTKQGIDKAYGLRQIEEHLKIPIANMLFIGDAIFPGGNDYAATTTGVEYVKVSGPEETKKVIEEIVK
jgi:hydroxymethylpyrimidine pyrophosphatase-like HAD family hydrolase